MNEVDDAVRTMLTARAASVPPSPVLLDGVHRRIRRHRNRRRALVGAAAATALLAAGGVAWSADRSPDRLVPADRPSATATAAPDQGSRKLVPGNPKVPAAPLAPGALPRGFPTPTLALDTKNSWIYTSTRTTAPHTGLTIRISRTPLTALKDKGVTRRVTIGQTPATLYAPTPALRPWDTGTGYQGAFAELTYRHPSGVWVQVVAGHDDGSERLDLSVADIVGVAENLSAEPTPVPDLLRFASVPEGLVVGAVWAGFELGGPEVQFVSPRAGQQTSNPKANSHRGGGPDVPITVHAGPADSAQISVLTRLYPARRTISVGSATISVSPSDTGNGQTVYMVPLGNGDVLAAIVDDRLELSDATMASFLTGITPGPDY